MLRSVPTAEANRRGGETEGGPENMSLHLRELLIIFGYTKGGPKLGLDRRVRERKV